MIARPRFVIATALIATQALAASPCEFAMTGPVATVVDELAGMRVDLDLESDEVFARIFGAKLETAVQGLGRGLDSAGRDRLRERLSLEIRERAEKLAEARRTGVQAQQEARTQELIRESRILPWIETKRFAWHENLGTHVGWSPDGAVLVAGDGHRDVAAWDMGTETQLWRDRGVGFATLPDPGMLAVGTAEGVAYRDIRTGLQVGEALRLRATRDTSDTSWRLDSFITRSSGRPAYSIWVASTRQPDNTYYTSGWVLVKHTGRKRLRKQIVSRGERGSGDATLSPDGSLLVFSSQRGEQAPFSGRIYLRSTRSGRDIPLENADQKLSRKAVFSADGRWLASVSSEDGLVYLWSVRPTVDPKPRIFKIPMSGRVQCIEFHPDSESIWVGGREGRDGKVFKFDVETGTPQLEWEGKNLWVMNFRFDPTGHRLAVSTMGIGSSQGSIILLEHPELSP
jgi:WD40 repeat protein